MERKTKHLFIVSFDALCTLDFEYITSLPNFNKFISNASYCKKVFSVYPTLTYPAHATIVTGKYPKNHGIVNNTLMQPNRESPDWYWRSDYIKGDTLYDIALDKGMKVAALLWPVTAKSRIQYNMPEIFANRSWHNQVAVSLFNGSPLYQIELNRRYGHLRHGLKQPNLDDFTHASFLYTIEKKKPDLSFAHYTDLDTMRHHHGFNSHEANMAIHRLDKRLGDIIITLKKNKMYEESTIVVLGDHGSIDEDKVINLNVLLKENGYIQGNKNNEIINYKAISKSCGGCTYVYVKDKDNYKLIEDIKVLIENLNKKYDCIEAIYSSEEAENLGADPECSLIIEANRGYYFLDNVNGEVIKEIQPHEFGKAPHMSRATHGYSPYKEDYTTVFMAMGKGVKEGVVVEEMNLVDEGPTLATILGFELPNVDGKVITEFIK